MKFHIVAIAALGFLGQTAAIAAAGSAQTLQVRPGTVVDKPFGSRSAQGAADVVQTYFALIGERKYSAAYALWSTTPKDGRTSRSTFVRSFSRYTSYRANVGAPSRIEAAAGSAYVTVPVRVDTVSRMGELRRQNLKVVLRRANAPGAASASRMWRIYDINS